MSKGKLLINLEPKQGFNDVFRIGNYGMNLTSFGILKLAEGTSYKANTGEFEVALVRVSKYQTKSNSFRNCRCEKHR